ncbi:general secretion pathway protein GspL [Pseudomonas aeruginosa]|uniref:type II secretion system protein GspL n=1 Tax=Pseudomonas aeruginosa TaxID=287 RepID=UPI000F52C01F|nr:type II secretion system protein GspL [Pseudomonas aeruginosa]MCO2978535.1 general secretion pathway protein GspL [Pseudomonas aeruginosa]QIZ27801.1 general secretion pathway protein GspL [Pseudomonas aeruginosa]RQI01170.1 general secretion pathway protein GspL [Pseudomonas aeruginosa]
MQACLYLTSTANDAPLTWWRADGIVHHGDLEQAAAELAEAELTLLLPAEAASHHEVEVPARSGRWLRQALHSALEERLLEDLDDLHLARANLRDGRFCRVFAVRRDWLRERLAQLLALRLLPHRIHVDADCLPGDPPLALRCAGRWLVAAGETQRLALDDDALEDLAPLLPDGLRRSEETPWPVLAEGARQAIDLRQDEFAAHAEKRIHWPLLALLAVLACAAQLGQDIGHRMLLEQRSTELRQGNLALWQQRFPNEGRVVDLARQVQARLRQDGQSPVDLARRLERLAHGWSAGGGATATVRRLDYQAGEGWSLQVGAPAFADLERLREGLARQGLDVQADSSVRDLDGVSARLQIKD